MSTGCIAGCLGSRPCFCLHAARTAIRPWHLAAAVSYLLGTLQWETSLSKSANGGGPPGVGHVSYSEEPSRRAMCDQVKHTWTILPCHGPNHLGLWIIRGALPHHGLNHLGFLLINPRRSRAGWPLDRRAPGQLVRVGILRRRGRRRVRLTAGDDAAASRCPCVYTVCVVLRRFLGLCMCLQLGQKQRDICLMRVRLCCQPCRRRGVPPPRRAMAVVSHRLIVSVSGGPPPHASSARAWRPLVAAALWRGPLTRPPPLSARRDHTVCLKRKNTLVRDITTLAHPRVHVST